MMLRELVGTERLRGRRLHLIRHARPEIERAVPPEHWHLSAEGRINALALGGRIALTAGTVFCSPEPRARETGAIIAGAAGAQVAVHPGLSELGFRAGFLAQEEFSRRVRAYLDGGRDAAFEPYDDARRRIVACLAELCRSEEGDLALVSHGRIMTVLLGDILGRRLGAAEWALIAMPDWTLLDLEAGRALKGFALGF